MYQAFIQGFAHLARQSGRHVGFLEEYNAWPHHAFMPQGAGEMSGHKCAGYDFSTVMMQLFAILLVRGHTWQLPRQDLGMRWNRIPPEYKSGLVVRARKIQPVAVSR